ncbi:class I SAM-dependent methyltransferase [Dolichospermum sp. ST_con]|nr:class I SAM-dependent methyltransferase [Dolichospermum sp. ST_con]MDD1417568.1 class I SAM-dependent methyltransferase [Dolichospermum sp. ST_sed1]MDD1423016.1 class I SAM-dependent methyltransferase [Dolichospermum sp. ST_sed9]MDD1430101.1 class I SAM-dependent methyltransferase [Dolichospermum sp. ST_sed6]MDD1437816.1 class I SAM-dependent methyltransferase [Dolichospermum sp. ST_sed10]MDD1439124.1 class I SAM-dependent methyltransferase [Dolichospermum sp. ST_sed3]MDD1444908.1 class I 
MSDKIQWVYSSQNNEELAQRYNQWAEDYERDLTENFGRPQREPIVDLTIKYVPKNAQILDAGVGTGIMGQSLHKEGYSNLIGIDLSQGMLAEAQKKNVYTELHQMILGEPLDFPNDAFNAVTACGVFTYGHAPSSSFDELIRVTKPTGYIIFTLRPDFYESSDFKEKMTDLETQGKWQLTELGEKYQAEPQGQPDLYLQTWVYQISL